MSGGNLLGLIDDMIKKNSQVTHYKVNIQTKPYPQSPVGIDETLKDERAPRRRFPLTDATNLCNQQDKSRCSYN